VKYEWEKNTRSAKGRSSSKPGRSGFSNSIDNVEFGTIDRILGIAA